AVQRLCRVVPVLLRDLQRRNQQLLPHQRRPVLPLRRHRLHGRGDRPHQLLLPPTLMRPLALTLMLLLASTAFADGPVDGGAPPADAAPPPADAAPPPADAAPPPSKSAAPYSLIATT